RSARDRSGPDRVLVSVAERRVVRRGEARIPAPPLAIDDRARDDQRRRGTAAETADRELVHVDREHARAIVDGRRCATGRGPRSAADRRAHAQRAALERKRGAAGEAVEEQAALVV